MKLTAPIAPQVMPTNPSFRTQIRPYGKAAIDEAARLIGEGACVAMPTETVYGLAADATNGAAVAGIYATKGRPSFNPLIVHVASLSAAEAIADFNDTARQLAAQYWPGPLTLVLPVKADGGVASLVTAGLSTIAVRVPAHPAMQDLLASTGKPLAAPSANASGSISPTRAMHVAKSLAGKVPLIVDAGATERGIESTIIAVGADGTLRLLRPGPIDFGLTVEGGGSIEAPGQLASHYAPDKPLLLDQTRVDDDAYLIGFGAVEGDTTLSKSGSLIEAAARLFDALHLADASDKPRIAVAPLPHQGLGLAINDRLRRAASPR
jgi:L-threonylcarbamoyladenylate synthase